MGLRPEAPAELHRPLSNILGKREETTMRLADKGCPAVHPLPGTTRGLQITTWIGVGL